jgi:hypothetical protein
MNKYFSKNSNEVAAVLTGKGFNNKLFSYIIAIISVSALSTVINNNGLFLGVFIVFISSLVIIDLKTNKLKKTVWSYELGTNITNVLNETHNNIVKYIEQNINDDLLIADHIFIIDTQISEQQTLENLKDKKTKVIKSGALASYLKSNKNWLINYRGQNHKLISPFRLTAICYLEHGLVTISQTCSLPQCTFNSININESKYLGLNYIVNKDKLVLDNFTSEILNSAALDKLKKITLAIKPYIEQ